MLTFLSIFSSSIGIPLSGGLTVFNRTRLVFGSIVTSLVKLIVIFYIFYSDWSLISVMVSSFLISLSGIIYVIINARQLIKTFGKLRTTIREFVSGFMGFTAGLRIFKHKVPGQLLYSCNRWHS